MKVGFQVVLYILIFNLTCGLVYAISVPGTQFSNILTGTGDVEDYQERVNPEEFMNKTSEEASNIFTFAGQILTGLSLVWDIIRFTIGGLPTMLIGIGGQLTPEAKPAYNAITAVLIAVEGFIVFLWLFQVFSGRQVED